MQDVHVFLLNSGPACSVLTSQTRAIKRKNESNACRVLTQRSQRTRTRVGAVLPRSTDCRQQSFLPSLAPPEPSALKQQPFGFGQLRPEHEFQRLSRRAAAISAGMLIGCILGADLAVVYAEEQDADYGSPSDSTPGEVLKASSVYWTEPFHAVSLSAYV